MNSNTKHIKIKLNDYFYNSISTRNAIKSIFDFEKRNDIIKIILDFKEICFVTRSATHQLIIEIEKLEKKAVLVEIINISDDITKMIDIVKNSIRSPRKYVSDVTKFRFNKKSDLFDFLNNYVSSQ